MGFKSTYIRFIAAAKKLASGVLGTRRLNKFFFLRSEERAKNAFKSICDFSTLMVNAYLLLLLFLLKYVQKMLERLAKK